MRSVSVLMPAYNHEYFIAEAIESVLRQKTDFPVQIVIGEDCSTDNTRSICLKYKEMYPEQIALILHEKNIGSMKNVARIISACSGKYIAICDGDDYWTDDLKLQKQVNILEQNKSIGFCFHIGDDLENGKIVSNNPFPRLQYDFKDFAAYGCFIKALSAVFVNSDFIKKTMQEKWVESLSGGDQIIYLLSLLDNKKAIAINEHMGVYRHHNGGIWSGKSNKRKMELLFNDMVAYKTHLFLSVKQKYYINWQLKRVLMSSLYNYNDGQISLVVRLRNIFINRFIFIFGPGYLSGIMVDLWMKAKNNKLH